MRQIVVSMTILLLQVLTAAATPPQHLGQTQEESTPPPPVRPVVEVETSEGVFALELWPEKAPEAVANFLGNVEAGSYEGTIFHRVVKGFVIQGGGYTENLEPKPSAGLGREFEPTGTNVRYSVGVASRLSDRASSAQFYINLSDNRSLDRLAGGQTVFGAVIESQSTIDRIANVEVGKIKSSSTGVDDKHVPIKPVRILRVKLRKSANHLASAVATNHPASSEREIFQGAVPVDPSPGRVMLAKGFPRPLAISASEAGILVIGTIGEPTAGQTRVPLQAAMFDHSSSSLTIHETGDSIELSNTLSCTGSLRGIACAFAQEGALFLLQYDHHGIRLSKSTLSIAGLSLAANIALRDTTDGGFVLAGTESRVDGKHRSDALVLARLSSDGGLRWVRSLPVPGKKTLIVADVAEVGAEGFAILGTTIRDSMAMLLARTDSLGKLVWMDEEFRDDMVGRALTLVAGTKIVVAGRSTDERGNAATGMLEASRLYVAAVDLSGDKKWDHYFGVADGRVNPNEVLGLSDGGVLVIGNAQGNDFPHADSLERAFVLRLNAEGETLVQRQVSELGPTTLSHAVARANGLLLIVGTRLGPKETLGTGGFAWLTDGYARLDAPGEMITRDEKAKGFANVARTLSEEQPSDRSGWLSEALHLYEKAIELDSENVEARWGAASLLEYAGEYDQAVLYYKWIVDRSPRLGDESIRSEAKAHLVTCRFLGELRLRENDTPQKLDETLEPRAASIVERQPWSTLRDFTGMISSSVSEQKTGGSEGKVLQVVLDVLQAWQSSPIRGKVDARNRALVGMVSMLVRIVADDKLEARIGALRPGQGYGALPELFDTSATSPMEEEFKRQNLKDKRVEVAPNLAVVQQRGDQTINLSGSWTMSGYATNPFKGNRREDAPARGVSVRQDGESVEIYMPAPDQYSPANTWKCTLTLSNLSCSTSGAIGMARWNGKSQCRIESPSAFSCEVTYQSWDSGGRGPYQQEGVFQYSR